MTQTQTFGPRASLGQFRVLFSRQVAEFLDRAVVIAQEAAKLTEGKKLKDFAETVAVNAEVRKMCAELKDEVNAFASKYPMPGFDEH